MNSSRPYLIRALYEWIVDNNMTPHLLINTELDDVTVPAEHIHEGRIVLNINPTAVQNLALGNKTIEFNARFSGIECFISFPPRAVLAIYARENGQGMAFGEEPEGGKPPPEEPKPGGNKKPRLKVVK